MFGRRYILAILFCVALSSIGMAQSRIFLNNGFEPPYTPTVAGNLMTNESTITGWKTTATDNLIEVWQTGFNGIASQEGVQFVELNATQASRLYQTVYLANGETFSWNYWHRGRASAVTADVMQLNIYNSAGTAKVATLQTASTTNAAWANYVGSWLNTLATGMYQFSFEAISTASGSISIGNFIDNCQINLSPLVEFSGASFSGAEWLGNDGIPSIIVNGTVPAGGTTVSFTIAGGTATNITDYTIANLFVPAGAYSPANPVPIPLSIIADALAEGNETVIINISGATNTAQVMDANGDGVNRSQCTYTIFDKIAPGGVYTGLKVWLRSDKEVFSNNTGTTPATHGSAVKYWKDFSPMGNNAVIVSPANTPTYQVSSSLINYNPTVYFSNGDAQYFDVTLSGIKSSNYTLFAAHQRSSSDANSFIMGTQSTTNGQGLYFGYKTSTQIGLSHWGGTPATATVPDYNAPQSAAILTGFYNGVGKSITEYRNSTSSGSGVVADATALSGAAQGVVGHGNSTDGYIGYATEIITYNRTLTATEQTQVLSYLAIRNGITLDQTTATDYLASDGTTTFWNAATAAAYKYDIAVIVRDDYSGLHQKQSASANAHDNIIIGLGEIATSNATNANLINTDKNALSWANNNGLVDSWGVTDYGTSSNGEVILSRIARAWQVQKTGTVGSTHIKINLSAVSATMDLQYSRLLVDANGVFNVGAVSVAPATYDNTNKTVEFDYTFTAATTYISVGTINTTLSPLPISLTQFGCKRTGNNSARIDWQTASEQEVDSFYVERSTDGRFFSSIAACAAQGNSKQTQNYSLFDHNAPQSVTYYRLQHHESDGLLVYSKVIAIPEIESNSSCTITTLNQNKSISILLIDNKRTVAEVQIIASDGRIIKQQQIFTNSIQTINLSMVGVFVVRVMLDDSNIENKIVVVNE